MQEKLYKITFTNKYEYDFYDEEKRRKWQPIVKELDGKEVPFSMIPRLIELYDRVVVEDDTVEIYNDWRE